MASWTREPPRDNDDEIPQNAPRYYIERDDGDVDEGEGLFWTSIPDEYLVEYFDLDEYPGDWESCGFYVIDLRPDFDEGVS